MCCLHRLPRQTFIKFLTDKNEFSIGLVGGIDSHRQTISPFFQGPHLSRKMAEPPCPESNNVFVPVSVQSSLQTDTPDRPEDRLSHNPGESDPQNGHWLPCDGVEPVGS